MCICVKICQVLMKKIEREGRGVRVINALRSPSHFTSLIYLYTFHHLFFCLFYFHFSYQSVYHLHIFKPLKVVLCIIFKHCHYYSRSCFGDRHHYSSRYDKKKNFLLFWWLFDIIKQTCKMHKKNLSYLLSETTFWEIKLWNWQNLH